MDPDLRGAEFERITQNLDLQFWKSFWNLTESGLITVGGVTHLPITVCSPELLTVVSVPGLQQDGVHTGAGELHADRASAHPAPPAGL